MDAVTTIAAVGLDRDSIAAINDVVIRFCRGVDRHDRSILESCYHPGAYDDHGVYKGDAAGFIDWVLGATEGARFMQHTVSNFSVLAGGGDVVAAETYFHVRTLGLDGGLAQAFGRYADRFERRGGQWRIATRTCVVDYATENLGYDMTVFAEGKPDESDPSFGLVASLDA
jgi:hypothetical protein